MSDGTHRTLDLAPGKDGHVLRVVAEPLVNDPFPGAPEGDQAALLTLSDHGKDFLIEHESVRVRAYDDNPASPDDAHTGCTIGIGHLIRRGFCLSHGQFVEPPLPEEFRGTLSDARVGSLLEEDSAWRVAKLGHVITSRVNQCMFDALFSLLFNGIWSNEVFRLINTRQYSKVGAEMMKYTCSTMGPGTLTGRRRDEVDLFYGRYKTRREQTAERVAADARRFELLRALSLPSEGKPSSSAPFWGP